MDGRKNKLIHSLQFRLSIGTAIAIVVVAIIAGIFSYWWAFEEAIELQDEQLIRLVALVNHQVIQPEMPVEISTADPESHFVVQWLDKSIDSTLLELPEIPFDLQDGLQTHFVNGANWRMLVKSLQDGSRVVVAQQTEVRDEIARASALNTLIPLFILIPLLLMWVAYLIRIVFSPLKMMAAQLNTSSDTHLLPLPDENLASEVAPFITAINQLLRRVNDSIRQQRQFVRDAAHELRSPLTAISLQTERMIESNLQPELQSRLINLHKATERTRILIEQLLTMARVQDNLPSSKIEISIKGLLREILEDLVSLAELKTIEILVNGDDISVHSQPIDLQILIKNLIENAIRYTPDEGLIEIILISDANVTEIIIKDSGPGIPESEIDRVFDPFYRVPGSNQPGSGLGLSIVKTIADRLGLKVQLRSTEYGLSAHVIF